MVICGRFTLFSIGPPASVVPEQKWPNSSTFFGSSAIFWATALACFGSQASSSGLMTIFFPSRPPLAFHSSAAIWIPFRYPWPSWATSPVSGPAQANWISPLSAAPPAAGVAPAAAAVVGAAAGAVVAAAAGAVVAAAAGGLVGAAAAVVGAAAGAVVGAAAGAVVGAAAGAWACCCAQAEASKVSAVSSGRTPPHPREVKRMCISCILLEKKSVAEGKRVESGPLRTRCSAIIPIDCRTPAPRTPPRGPSRYPVSTGLLCPMSSAREPHQLCDDTGPARACQ